MGALAGPAMIAGTGLSVFGKLQSGKAQGEADLYKAEIARQNATFAQQQAITTAQIGDQDVANQELLNAAKYGATKAYQGASGFTVNQGSNADVLTSERELGRLDAMTIRSNAIRKAYGLQVQSLSDTEQATLETKAAKNAVTTGEIGAASTLLGGAGKYAMFGGSSKDSTDVTDPYKTYQNSHSLNSDFFGGL